MRPTFPLDPTAKFYVAGHKGMVGSAIWRALENKGHTNLIGATSGELDLRNRAEVFSFFRDNAPDTVVLAAGLVGGIQLNSQRPADFISVNLQIQVNVLDAALEYGVERLLFMGSSCIYPKFATQPIREDSLLTGHLEPSNDAYAVAKIAGITQVQAIRRQHDKHWISVMPTNLYGPGDNYSEQGSHVLPALIRRLDQARRSGAPSVTNWGSGTPLREFLYVDDLADACLFLLEHYDGAQQVNVGVGEDISIASLAEMIAEEIGFKGEILWDSSKPDGTPRKLLDVSFLKELGWTAQTPLREGIRLAIADYRANYL